MIVRNVPDLSVDADCWQDPAANRPQSGHFDRLAAQLDRFDPLAGLGNKADKGLGHRVSEILALIKRQSFPRWGTMINPSQIARRDRFSAQFLRVEKRVPYWGGLMRRITKGMSR